MGLFSKKDKTARVSTNPYISGQKLWNDIYGHILKSAQTDRFISRISIIIAACSLWGMYSLNSRVKFVPYVVVMDSKKEVLGTVLPESVDPDERFLRYDITDFLISWRSVVGDVVVMKNNFRKVFSRIEKGSAAFKTVSSYLKDPDNPIDSRIQKERVRIEIIAVLPQSKTSWQIDWKEIKTSTKDDTKVTTEYRGLFKISIHEMKSVSNIPINPLGIQVSEINIDKIYSNLK